MSVEVVDLAAFLALADGAGAEGEALEACKAVVKSLETTGILIIRDPRVQKEQNDVFIDQMEEYFSQPLDKKMSDTRPDLHFQVGATPGGQEVPQPQDEAIANLKDKPLPFSSADPKWRFFWRIGERPKDTEFAEMNAEPVIPAAFPNWAGVMNTWGSHMKTAVMTVSEMLAVGYGLDRKAFRGLLENGPHLLAPTGTDVETFGKVGTVYAGFHQDLNFLTIHGKSRYPGLFVWLRDGTKMPVKVPDGCLILQAGMQLEYMTGGQILAGYHEVVCTDATVAAYERQKAAGRPTWRVSSTCFTHVASDNTLEPLQGKFDKNDAKYPAIKAGKFVEKVLQAINLAKK